ncbi:SspB family protein [Lichenibacterium ramalinae]|uniref:Stringent starvation protein B n=1 Tax=Lichenibacterium ramalinae TaxID=2316527 RepID=A0A4Q2R656_9HYPH|nr:ClpXP protease specificity-enhancing factor SspB [Lichenibacterium ramalinae]RYB01842.1 Stringent starvation protein B [Lichenibacterium ramalinae]
MADLIRYDLLVQDALRGVVRQVLTDVARNGLQGEHHFFITFKTATAGLRLSNRMRERYPDEMTVILQHQFWGLTVTEAGFEVGLSFNNMPERLFVPFAAITMFQDPSVTFGLKFDVKDGDGAAEGSAKPGAETPRPALAEAPKGLRALATVDTNLPARIGDGTPKGEDRKDRAADKPKADKPKPVLAKVEDEEEDDKGGGTDKGAGTKVVSIDAFRKKP